MCRRLPVNSQKLPDYLRNARQRQYRLMAHPTILHRCWINWWTTQSHLGGLEVMSWLGFGAMVKSARLSVVNWGSTLPADIANRLFEPMVSSSKDARRSHLGLGLYIVRIIAEFHGGTVSASNRKANGRCGSNSVPAPLTSFLTGLPGGQCPHRISAISGLPERTSSSLSPCNSWGTPATDPFHV